MFKKFLSIFISKFPDRFACLVIIISIFSLGSFAYDTVGLPIQTASAESLNTADGAVQSAVGWAYMQKCFGDRIKPDTIVTDVQSSGNDVYNIKLSFVSLAYKVDQGTGGLHHIPVNHSVEMVVSRGKVVSAYENFHDLINGQVSGPIACISTDCY
ncbi:MAG TPA: hypothetical protein VMC84_05920 [Methanocella sp.]|uniref:hypothetical protein n=1 Tax=Methanocella sp. TaxID=2052833 RepID=UPI002C6419C1|nr:hypothetical protein [Methanocella sp.]HTY90698.1 hypothetical protein [Methanocella sp.]